MSRCFPFPPPGYVRKAGVESAEIVDLPKQDKPKEKKGKKEKDREKREGKERKEKDRIDEKHRDKKEKKDKHRDKKKEKKEKEKEKEKEKQKEGEKDHSSSSNDRKRLAQSTGISIQRTPKEKGASPSVDRSIWKEKERDKQRNSTLDKQRNSTPDGKRPAGRNIEKLVSVNNNSLCSTYDDDNGNSKCEQELERHVRNDRSSGAQLAEKFIAVERKKDEGMVQLLAKPSLKPEGKEWIKERRDNEQKVGRVNGTLKVQNFGGAVQSRVQEVVVPLEQNVEREMERREKFKGRESEYNKQADKWKENDGEKKGQWKVKELGREREDERTREKIEQNRHSEQEGLKLSRKNDLVTSPNKRSPQHPVKEPDKAISDFGNVIKKRKEPETTVLLHANEIRTSKMPKQPSLSHHPLENGRKSEPHQTPSVHVVASPVSVPINNGNNNILKPNKDERKINGVTVTRLTSPASTVDVKSTSQANNLLLAAELPLVRLPHPESKYLDEILSRIPRLEDLPELDDDQRWLFGTDFEDSKKGPVMREEEETPQVWGECVAIESADIYALPYVIPY